jgi:hypothetical protein
MNRSAALSLLRVMILLCATSSLFAQQQTQPQPAGPDEGYQTIFDGKTLANWEGDTKFWRAEDGNLVGEITPGNQITQNSFIVYKGQMPGDFDLKMEYRITDQGNSGINYRSTMVDGAANAMKGYQFDIDGEKRSATVRHTANNYEERGRTFMALRGQITRALPGGKREVIGTIGDYKELAKVVKSNDWNQVHIIARGNTLMHILNGQIMSVLIDEDAANRTMGGLLGVQVHTGPPMKIEYRNIRVKAAEPEKK